MTKLDDVKAALGEDKNDRLPYGANTDETLAGHWLSDNYDVVMEALALYQAVLEKQKVMIVPVEITRQMWESMGDEMVNLMTQPSHHKIVSDAVYKAMTAAVDKEALIKEVTR